MNKFVTVLLVDAGNSRIKWAVLQASGRTAQQARAYPPGTESPQQALSYLAELLVQLQPQRLVLVHVLGIEFAAQLAELCAQHHCRLTLVNNTEHAGPVQLAYPDPARLGTDRLVGLLAARRLAAGRAVISIDCGTAVTVDALLADGRHLGGVILPGLQLLGDALISRTRARHMDTALFDQPVVFADNTARGMGSGCLFALVGAIEGICQRMRQQLPEPPLQVLCGGDAGRLHAELLAPETFLLEPEALMIGLQDIAERD